MEAPPPIPIARGRAAGAVEDCVTADATGNATVTIDLEKRLAIVITADGH